MIELLAFLDKLQAYGLHYVLGHYRESINVHVTVPGARWEVEFFADGHTEVEVFVADGHGVGDAERLDELFAGPTEE